MRHAPILAALLATPILASFAAAPPDAERVETVELETSDHFQLAGTLYLPRLKKGKRAPGALLVHDAGADRSQLDTLAQRMRRQGFAVLTIDLRGHGKSGDEDDGWKGMDAAQQKTLWAFATRDVEAGARWLIERPEVHSTNLSLLGVRAGCALAVRHAARDENVRSLALLGPTPEVLGFDVAEDLLELSGMPSLVVVKRDEAEETQKMVDAANGVAAHRWIDVVTAGKGDTGILADRRMPSEVSKWLHERAVPGRGDGRSRR